MTSTDTDDRQERILSAVRKGEKITLDAIKTAVDAASRVTGKIPGVKLPFEAKLPFAGTLAKLEGKFPRPEALVSGTYDFAEKLLAEQRKFAGEVLKTTAALRPAAKDEAAKDEAAKDTPAGQ